jgi:hypothetical protein
MSISFLFSQIELMLNMLNSYFEQVSIKTWRVLEEVINQKKNYLDHIITNSDKPRIKDKVEKLFPEMIEVLKNKITSNIERAA